MPAPAIVLSRVSCSGIRSTRSPCRPRTDSSSARKPAASSSSRARSAIRRVSNAPITISAPAARGAARGAGRHGEGAARPVGFVRRSARIAGRQPMEPPAAAIGQAEAIVLAIDRDAPAERGGPAPGAGPADRARLLRRNGRPADLVVQDRPEVSSRHRSSPPSRRPMRLGPWPPGDVRTGAGRAATRRRSIGQTETAVRHGFSRARPRRRSRLWHREPGRAGPPRRSATAAASARQTWPSTTSRPPVTGFVEQPGQRLSSPPACPPPAGRARQARAGPGFMVGAWAEPVMTFGHPGEGRRTASLDDDSGR